MLHILAPIAYVLGTICMQVKSIAIGFIVGPLPFILITVGMPETTLTACLSILPLTFVFAAIGPDLSTVGLPDTVFVEVALEDGTRLG
jgi:hypothetical protein